MGDFLQLASQWPVVRRALGFAVVVGVILVTINYGDRILRGESLGATELVKIGLTLCVPYVVSTLSSVAAMRDHVGSGGPMSDG